VAGQTWNPLGAAPVDVYLTGSKRAVGLASLRDYPWA
jgi:hypothetical protein